MRKMRRISRRHPAFSIAACLAVLLSVSAPTAHAAVGGPGSFFFPDKTEEVPPELRNVSVTEHRGDSLPLDLTFQDDTGQTVRLGQYFSGRKPVILQLGYYGCPMLCSLVSKGLSDSLKQISLNVGADYEVIFVSINPNETWDLAAKKKQSYINDYDRPGTAAGWHFLVGQQDAIGKLAAAVGFTYKWVASAKQYSHPAALVLSTPDGRISRYLYGVKFDPGTLRLSLVDVSDGKIGSAVDELFLTCFQYDGHQGKYALAAMGLMKISGAATVLAVIAIVILLLRREHRRNVEGAPVGA